MANPNQLLNLQPLDTEDLGVQPKVPTNTNPHSPPTDILQLQTDVINVLEGRVEISSFPANYQKKIKDYYRYSASVHLSKYPIIAKRTSDTMDLV
jgi:hypothetical protein